VRSFKVKDHSRGFANDQATKTEKLKMQQRVQKWAAAAADFNAVCNDKAGFFSVAICSVLLQSLKHGLLTMS